MKYSIYIKSLLTILLALFFLKTNSQDLINSRETSYYTYIYKLTDREAKKIYKKDAWVVDQSYFHTLVDSFPTDSGFFGNLNPGHYLKTFSDGNKQKYSITSINNFEVFILNNNTDLCVQVYDLDGNIISNAKVNAGNKRLRFNKVTQSYTDKKSNRKGLLKVVHNGTTGYYSLERQFNNSLIRRSARTVAYNAPVKYVWLPVNFIVHLPIDGVKSIRHGWPYGTIHRTQRFFVRTFEKVACIFDDYYCTDFYDYKFRQNHRGFMVFNKPLYQPGDTVKFKAYIVTKNGRPISKPVDIALLTNRKTYELGKLKPYREGGFEYSFFLHDSLQLQLDRNYSIELRNKDGKNYFSASFRYEDYELKKNSLSLRTSSNNHYRNSSVELYIKGTDENDLNLLDARLEILVKPKVVFSYFENRTFIPDTLLYFEQRLDPVDETEVIISDSSFPKANFEYEIVVRLYTSDNEVVSDTKSINYYNELNEFDIKLIADSIRFDFKSNGMLVEKLVSIHAQDNFGNRSLIHTGKTPSIIPLNTYFSSYIIKTDSISKEFKIADKPSLLQCFSERTSDSIFISVENPRNIPFSYNIYKVNTEKDAGFGSTLEIQSKEKSKKNYYISIRYLWGGKVKEDNYLVPLNDDKLNVSVIQPRIVYPGQKTEIEVLVTDYKGNPVKGVDLTAYSLTKKFNYTPPQLPSLGKSRKSKSIINNFSFKKPDDKQEFWWKDLNYNSWKAFASIDTIEYYKFLYPKDSIYRFVYQTADSITQFAPFVLRNGEIKPIHVIYVNNKPVYFSWSTNYAPYSFKVKSGYNQIKLRTRDDEITLNNFFFEKGKKTIFSLDSEIQYDNIKIEKLKPELSVAEQRLLYRYVFPYRNTFGDKFGFLEQDEQIHFLKPKSSIRTTTNFAGPIVGNTTFHLLDNYTINFTHEPFFEYDFSPGLLKMRNVNRNNYPKHLSSNPKETSFSDLVFTKPMIEKEWENYLNTKRHSSARYSYPNSTSKGFGKLLIDYCEQDNHRPLIPLNLLVFKNDNHEFLRIYPGNTRLIHELSEGYHKLILFYSGSQYHIEDSIYVNPNGLNYYKLIQPNTFQKDTFSLFVSNLIEQTLFSPRPHIGDAERELKKIYSHYQEQFRYSGEGDFIEGYVTSAEDGLAIPGVNVVIKGTTFGTVTNMDGFYSLKAPKGFNTLVFAFIGMVSQEVSIGSRNTINVELTADQLALEEVIVVGYGVSKQSQLTSSVQTVASNNFLAMTGVSGNVMEGLYGKVAGIAVRSNDGSATDGITITIRGASTLSFEKTPLYIINGMVFTGDISELDPSFIKSIETLKGENAVALYGSRAANGVLIIQTTSGAFQASKSIHGKGAEFDDSFFEAVSQTNSIRDNFSDYAFWEPKLITDKDGKARFEVVFPDDITSWETFYLAMNSKRQSGQTSQVIKSYKPLMAQLVTPRFLIQSDTTFAIGKTLNYLPDSIEVNSSFEINGDIQFSSTKYCIHSIIDTLEIVALSDSISVKYYIEKADGYFDGELRNIPVYPIGMEETKGQFFVLDKDTTINLRFEPTLGEVSVFAKADILDVIENETRRIIGYRYACNEQIASKVKALLAEKSIAEYKGDKFKKENEIRRYVRLLRNNQKPNGLWGWWKNSEEKVWISLHVLEALANAEKLGYGSKINTDQIISLLVWKYENTSDFYSKIKILKILHELDAQVAYSEYISKLEKTDDISLNGLLHLIELKQQRNTEYNTDTLNHYRKTTVFGNIFFEDNNQDFNLLNNSIQNTIIAYRIFREQPVPNEEELRKIRNFFFEKRGNSYWQNTYESAQIIETILPDLLNIGVKLSEPTLQINGDTTFVVKEFPHEFTINPSANLEITKKGDFPVYLTSYQTSWNSSPSLKQDDFEIKTRFDEESLFLQAGKESKIIVEVKVKKDAEYVMINIPIPAGCSYGEKRTKQRFETHREYFRNETTIFCEFLSKGDYIFEVELIPRYNGTYTVNPAKIELMYFPTFNANNEMKTVRIK